MVERFTATSLNRTWLDLYIIKEVNTGENLWRLQFVSLLPNVQEAANPTDLSSGLSSKLPSAMIGAASPLDPWAKRVFFKRKQMEKRRLFGWVYLISMQDFPGEWWCAELVFLCAMSPDHVLYPPDLVCSLVLLDSLSVLQVLPLLPKARTAPNCPVRQIVSGVRRSYHWFEMQAEKYSLHSEVDLLAVESRIWFWRVASMHPQEGPDLWKTNLRNPCIFFLSLQSRIGSFVLALLIVSSLSARGYEKATEGFDVTNCAAAKMVPWLHGWWIWAVGG